MKKCHFFSLLQVACFVLISLLLQNCGGTSNPPIQENEEPSIPTTIEQEEREQIEIEGELSIIGENQEQGNNTLPTLMPELWQYIFSHLDFKGILSARAVSSDWNKLITGFKETGIVGVENKPQHIIDTRAWIKDKGIDFKEKKLSWITPKNHS